LVFLLVIVLIDLLKWPLKITPRKRKLKEIGQVSVHRSLIPGNSLVRTVALAA